LPNLTLSGSDIQTAVLANWNQLTKLENLLEQKAAEQFFALASIHQTRISGQIFSNSQTALKVILGSS
jgi:hypothetical protein